MAAGSEFLPNATLDPSRDLVHVGYRLAALGVFPSSADVSRVQLAEAGFYSRGHSDEVICYSCGLRHSGWSRGDRPMDVHRRLSPDCAHVVRKDRERAAVQNAGSVSGAVASGSAAPGQSEASFQRLQQSEAPVAGASSSLQGASVSTGGQVEQGSVSQQPPGQTLNIISQQQQEQRSESQQPPRQPQLQPQSSSGTSTPSASVSVTSSSTVPEPSAASITSPPAAQQQRFLFPQARLDLGRAVHPSYTTFHSRRNTYTSWNENRAPSSQSLALTGFFYQGYADCVACFFCGVRLKNWVVNDDIIKEHVRWRPECLYLRAIKGEAVINEIRRSLEAEARRSTQNPPSPTPTTVTTTTTSAATTPAVVSTTTSAATTPAVVSTTAAPVSSGTQETSAPPASTGGQGAAAHTRASSSSAAVTSEPSPSPSTSSLTSGQGTSCSDRYRPAEVAAGNVREDETEEERVARLRLENQQLRNVHRCRLCGERQVNTIFMPCGHLIVCDICGPTVTSCPHCGQAIRATAHVYLE